MSIVSKTNIRKKAIIEIIAKNNRINPAFALESAVCFRALKQKTAMKM